MTCINYINKWNFVISKFLFCFYCILCWIPIYSLFSNLLLCRIIDIACFIAICYGIDFTKGLSNGFFWYFEFFSKIFIEGMCVVALAPAVMTINGSTFHPLLVM